MPLHIQRHLDPKATVDHGSFYTPPLWVNKAYAMLESHLPSNMHPTILETSCGYGGFFDHPFARSCRLIGEELDPTAAAIAQQKHPNAHIFCSNALCGVERSKYGLSESTPLVIVGNPPYNDKTSLIKRGMKTQETEDTLDLGLKARDLGLSFLLSYARLTPDWVCVLHPLSYLIKPANFRALKPFLSRYRLTDTFVISSGEFAQTSRINAFPVVIALYRNDPTGTTFNDIQNYRFHVNGGEDFALSDFDFISRYIRKYPSKKPPNHDGAIAEATGYFWTMRDINALDRSRTWLPSHSANTIVVPKADLGLYAYVDAFKDYIPHIPYYLRNCDVMIDYSAFKAIEWTFIAKSLQKHEFLQETFPQTAKRLDSFDLDTSLLDKYFKTLLGKHYATKG